MGISTSKDQRSIQLKPLVSETQIFALWTLKEVRELWKAFRTQVFGYSLVESQFEAILSFNKDVSDHVDLEDLFQVLDNDNDGRIDGLELLGGLALVCQATFEEKARFCFELFDFNLNSSLSEKEMVMMMMSTVCGLNVISGGEEESEPDVSFFENLTHDAFLRADRDNSGAITCQEFIAWARSNRDMMSGLESLNKLAIDAKAFVQSDDSAPEAESEGSLSDAEISRNHGTEQHEKSNQNDKLSTLFTAIDLNAVDFESNNDNNKDEFMAIVPWRGQIHEPSNFHVTHTTFEGPDSNLELSWAFGIQCQNNRNCVRYITSEKISKNITNSSNMRSNNKMKGNDASSSYNIVYPTAAVAVVYDSNENNQKFYHGHSSLISCLAIHPNGHILATGDVTSHIHVWDAGSMSTIAAIRGMSRNGIQLLAFSPTADRIAAIGADPDHTLSIYDYNTGSILSSAKGLVSPNNVFDIAYSATGSDIAIAGSKQVKFFSGVNGNKRALESKLGRIGEKGKKQTFFCVTYCREFAVVGCASGELYIFQAEHCVQIIQAHSPKEPILSMYFNPKEGILVTGCRDGVIKSWDCSFKEVGSPIDISDDLDGDGRPDSGTLNPAVTSVQMIGDRLLVATKGSDLFEIIVSSSASSTHSVKRIMWGHYSGELWGLAVHPLRDEFVTSGDDKTVRIWSVRSKEQINFKMLPQPARTIAYSHLGDLLGIGMEDGTVIILLSSNLAKVQLWNHTKKPITDIKFSPDGQFLAVGSKDMNIYLYKSTEKKQFKHHAVCRGHSGAITHIDFSSNSKYLQSNAMDYSLLHWDVKGNQVKSSASMRDISWDTYTCTLGWGVQGMWPKSADGTDINACHAVPDIGALVVGDDDKLVRLYRYPCVKQGCLHQKYVGHAGHIPCVRLSANRRYVLSVGGTDRTILLWTHDIEEHDSSSEDEKHHVNPMTAKKKTGSTPLLREVAAHVDDVHSDEEDVDIDIERELYEVLPIAEQRSLLQEAANRQKSTEELAKLLKECILEGDEDVFSAVKPWKAAVVEPSNWRSQISEFDDLNGATDVDLRLEWVHGIRSKDTRNNVRYSNTGDFIYFVAAVGVVYSKNTGKQRFLQGAHCDDIISLATHPSGQICATGEIGVQPAIVVWQVDPVKTIVKLEGVHKRGISLLAFNDKGNLLASIGMDEDSTLVVYDWAKSQMIFHVPTDKRKVLSLCFISSSSLSSTKPSHTSDDSDIISDSALVDVVVTAGENHIKYWWSQGQNVKSQKGRWISASGDDLHRLTPRTEGEEGEGAAATAPKEIITCIASASTDVCVTGTITGSLIIWKSFRKHGLVEVPHSTPIQTIWACKGEIQDISTHDHPLSFTQSSRYITGDKAGQIIIWKLEEVSELNHMQLIPLVTENSFKHLPSIHPIRSVTERNGFVLVSTRGGEIFEFEIDYSSFDSSTSSILSTINLHANRTHLIEKLSVGVSKDSSHSQLPPLTLAPQRTVSYLPCSSSISVHAAGGVRGLTTHPSMPYFITTGDDCTVRCWVLAVDHHLASYISIDSPGTCCEFSPSGGDVAVGLSVGLVGIYAFEQFLELEKIKKHSRSKSIVHIDMKLTIPISREIFAGGQSIKDIKYNAEGTLLAVGSSDMNVYIYCISNDVNYGYVCSLSGHTSFITHLDFGILLASDANDGKGANQLVLQSTCGNHELIYWIENEDQSWSRLTSPSILRDTIWETFTCPYGWPVQGIWPLDDDGMDITSVSRSHTYEEVPALVTADNYGRIRLFNYPCISPGAPDKCYRGHSNPVANVRFSYDDTYCISVGGSDYGVFVWASDIQEEARARRALLGSSAAKVKSSTALLFETGSIRTNNEDVSVVEEDFEETAPSKSILAPSAGDEAWIVQPWKEVVREPTDFVEPEDIGELPDASLELKFVYGYRGWDCRNNIGFGDDAVETIYHIAGVGIVYNSDTNTQVLNTEHDDDILCLAVHPAGHTVATGEIGLNPKIVIWDANTGVTLQVLKFHKRGVSALAFSGSGTLLVSIGMDSDRTVAVHNVSSGILEGSGKIGKGIRVYALGVGQDVSFVTGGKSHIKFWEFPTSTGGRVELSSKLGLFGKGVQSKTVICVAYFGVDVVSGMSDGNLLQWAGRTSTKIMKAHDAAVTAMCSLSALRSGGSEGSNSPRILSAGKDGTIHLWNHQLKKTWSFDMKTAPITCFGYQIQAIASKDDKILLGTKAGEIFEINLLSSDIRYKLVEGHFGEKDEVRGLAVHPSSPRFVTAGDDGTVRVWGAVTRCQIELVSVGAKARSVAYSSDGTQIAVGTHDGQLKVLSDDLSMVVQQLSLADRPIVAITYSLDGDMVAVGVHNGLIYILDAKSFSLKFMCKGHSSSILHCDFAVDSSYLQSTSASKELLFWDLKSGEQITTVSLVRDVKWATFTSIFGWPVQGIWPSGSDNSDIISVDRNPDGKLLVSGDDFRRVKLFKYPCLKENSKYKAYKGHSEQVACVKFSCDGKFLFTVGGLDKAILQYEVKNTTR